MGLRTPDLLFQAGYEPGTVQPALSINSYQRQSFSTGVFSYGTFTSLVDHLGPAADSFPGQSNTKVRLSAQLDPGTGEQVSVRVFNFSTRNPLAAIEDVGGFDNATSAWVDYDPSAQAEPQALALQARTRPANNTSDISKVRVDFGYALGDF